MIKIERVYVKTFPGATIQDMNFYIQPSLIHKPDILIIHAGTDNLWADENINVTAEKIIQLATNAKKTVKRIAIGSIVCKDDDLNQNAKEVNIKLRRKAAELNLNFLRFRNKD